MGEGSKQWRVVGAVAAGLIFMTFSGQLVRALPWPHGWSNIPYFLSSLSYLMDILVMLALLRLAGGVSWNAMGDAVGLARPWRAALLMGAILFVPVVVAMATLGRVSAEVTAADLVFGGLAFPFVEELTYRGLATGILLAVLGWRFWAAALMPAVIFGIGHFAQGNDLAEIGGVVAITAVGGLFFSWLYVRWGRNLWPAIMVHAGLNSLWSAFDLGQNALGGWLGNGLRLAVVAGAILLTLKGLEWLRKVAGEGKAGVSR